MHPFSFLSQTLPCTSLCSLSKSRSFYFVFYSELLSLKLLQFITHGYEASFVGARGVEGTTRRASNKVAERSKNFCARGILLGQSFYLEPKSVPYVRIKTLSTMECYKSSEISEHTT